VKFIAAGPIYRTDVGDRRGLIEDPTRLLGTICKPLRVKPFGTVICESEKGGPMRTIQLPDSKCVIKVGHGRGFVVERIVHTEIAPLVRSRSSKPEKGTIMYRSSRGTKNRSVLLHERLVITAAHCLPNLPTADPAAFDRERTYLELLGSLKDVEPSVAAECLFVDPVADIAVLGDPNGEGFEEQADAYRDLVDSAAILSISKPPTRSANGWVLELDGTWISTRLRFLSAIYGTILEIGPTKAGMSGSPILNEWGRAIGLVSLGIGTIHEEQRAPRQPILARDLPGKFLAEQMFA
jgi:hypothetical protein